LEAETGRCEDPSTAEPLAACASTNRLKLGDAHASSSSSSKSSPSSSCAGSGGHP